MDTTARFRVPKYRHFKPKDLAVVRLNGRDFYLGKYGSSESKEAYDRLIAEWLACGRQSPRVKPPEPVRAPISVEEVLSAFLRYGETYYVKDGQPTKELTAFKYAIEPVKQLYGTRPAVEFGPLALKAVREHLIERDICRTQVNARINRVKRIFKWAVSEELVPPAIYEGLRSVAGLRYGRSRARETQPVKPVPIADAFAVLPFVSPQVNAMIQLQALTGMRPGEVVIMRPCDIDRSRDPWIYEPADHKTLYRDHSRSIPLGPKAQAVIRPFLARRDDAYLFSPQEAEEWRNDQRAILRKPNRKTKVYPCELRARERRKKTAKSRRPKRPKRDRFDVDSYRRAIEYGITKAAKSGTNISHWHPHQLRHTFATEVREKYGVEAAQVSLGHTRADVTQIYAERDLKLAKHVANEMG